MDKFIRTPFFFSFLSFFTSLPLMHWYRKLNNFFVHVTAPQKQILIFSLWSFPVQCLIIAFVLWQGNWGKAKHQHFPFILWFDPRIQSKWLGKKLYKKIIPNEYLLNISMYSYFDNIDWFQRSIIQKYLCVNIPLIYHKLTLLIQFPPKEWN